MKKFILTLGSAAAALAPITAVVACEEATPEDPDATPEDPDATPEDPDATPPVEDEEVDPAVLKLHGFSSPDVEFPATGEDLTNVTQAIYIWTNDYAATNIVDTDGVTSISYKGETTEFTGGVANRVNLEGEFKVEDYIGENQEVFADLTELITYYENKWVEVDTMPNQLTPKGELLYGILKLKIS